MAITWILVANQARARLFTTNEEDDAIVEISSFANPDARAYGRELMRDRPPRTHDRYGAGRHAIEPHTELRDKTAEKFARALDSALERGRVDHLYDRLVVIASPSFLGRLNATFSRQLRTQLVSALPKDLTAARSEVIRSHLPH